MENSDKFKKADWILESLREEVLHILLNSDTGEYCNNQVLLPWLEEDAEYEIKKLHLNARDEKKYLQKITRILGVYSENIPTLERKKNNNNKNHRKEGANFSR